MFEFTYVRLGLQIDSSKAKTFVFPGCLQFRPCLDAKKIPWFCETLFLERHEVLGATNFLVLKTLAVFLKL